MTILHTQFVFDYSDYGNEVLHVVLLQGSPTLFPGELPACRFLLQPHSFDPILHWLPDLPANY